MTINRRIYTILLASGILLLIPFLAMQFTSQVNWSMGDFAVAAVIFLTVGISIDFVLRKVKSMNQRIIIALSILILFTLLWIELAVGIFGTAIAGS